MSATNTKKRFAFTFVELMIVLTIVGIAVALIAPSMSASAPDQLAAASRSLAADLEYARSLAISNNTSYQVTFDTTNNVYYLVHSGANAALDILPDPPTGSSATVSADGKRWTFDLTNLPFVRMAIALHSVRSTAGAGAEVADLEFGPLGETTRTDATAIWLSAGGGTNRRYQSTQINPVTGLPRIQELQARSPLTSLSDAEAFGSHDTVYYDSNYQNNVESTTPLPTQDGTDSVQEDTAP
ncbi:MAG: prepilin-type N-terminal cleavage/methylation domain-containing protein [Planctomycetales bacterium]|nr:prepilin-type N-terminal cleavage/methylation domain-containing protein [Planctomycetales bacterium]